MGASRAHRWRISAYSPEGTDGPIAELPIARQAWDGPLGVYPEAEREDYVDTHRDSAESQHVSPEDFVAFAQRAVGQGVQLVGGCCGIELEHIRPLRDALPSHIA